MTDYVKPDLAELDTDEIARLIVAGRITLSEVPYRQRRNSEAKVEQLLKKEETERLIKREEAEAAVAKAKAKAKKAKAEQKSRSKAAKEKKK